MYEEHVEWEPKNWPQLSSKWSEIAKTIVCKTNATQHFTSKVSRRRWQSLVLRGWKVRDVWSHFWAHNFWRAGSHHVVLKHFRLVFSYHPTFERCAMAFSLQRCRNVSSSISKQHWKVCLRVQSRQNSLVEGFLMAFDWNKCNTNAAMMPWQFALSTVNTIKSEECHLDNLQCRCESS